MTTISKQVQKDELAVRAKRLYRQVFGEPWPKKWGVGWVGDRNGASVMIYNDEMMVFYWAGVGEVHRNRHSGLPLRFCSFISREGVRREYFNDSLRRFLKHQPPPRVRQHRGLDAKLIHEFVHMRGGPQLRHGKQFYKVLRLARVRRRDSAS